MAAIEDYEKFRQVFFPYVAERVAHSQATGNRFAYYTSAAVGLNILLRKELWLRNATVMNDYLEVDYGLKCLLGAYNSPARGRLKAVLDRLAPGLATEFEAYFESWLLTIKTETYIICVSQHVPEEDRTGRLSMWRAYGRPTGVALVLNGGVMVRPTDALGIYSSPVHYASPESFTQKFTSLIAGLEENHSLLAGMGPQDVKNALLASFRFAVLCTKHPGFAEEQEWRAMACPPMYPSTRFVTSTEIIRGVPQSVIKLPLQNAPEQGLTGLDIRELLDRVIIGPCEFPLVTLKAFVDELVKLGFDDISGRVILSDIPLRHSS